jgi:hypothetical protein
LTKEKNLKNEAIHNIIHFAVVGSCCRLRESACVAACRVQVNEDYVHAPGGGVGAEGTSSHGGTSIQVERENGGIDRNSIN